MSAAIAGSQLRGHSDPDPALQFAIDVLRRAEAYGFSITLVAERFLGPDLESWMLSSALAANTTRIKIMPAVHPGIICPQLAAKMGATLDRISGGRCAVNVVGGWHKEEFNMFGSGWLDDDHGRSRRIDEFIRVLRGLWTDKRFSFGGDFFKVDDVELPFAPQQLPCPPIYAAGRSEAGKETIAQHCDTWFIMSGMDHKRREENVSGIAAEVRDMRQRSSAHGRRVRCAVNAHIVCRETDEEAMLAADELAAYGKGGRIPAIAVSGIGVGLIGTPEVVADRIRELEEIGIDLLMLKFSPMLEQLDVFAQEVLPLLGRAVPGAEPPADRAHRLQLQ
jgi:FMNH2-dependent dimethyl sulfone monooxygenase